MEKPFEVIPPWLFQGKPTARQAQGDNGVEKIEQAKATL
jgi:hypothetical protein